MSDKETKLLTVETNRSARDDSRSGSEPPDGHSRNVRIKHPVRMTEAGTSAKVPARKGTGPRTKLHPQRPVIGSLSIR